MWKTHMQQIIPNNCNNTDIPTSTINIDDDGGDNDDVYDSYHQNH